MKMSTFTNTQLIHFFTSTTQIGLTTVPRVALGEGLADVTDSVDFKENEIKIALKNYRQGIPTIPGIPAIPERRNSRGTIMQAVVLSVAPLQGVPPVLIPARSASRLYVPSTAYHYCIDTSREITAQNMHYTNVLKDFYIELKYWSKWSSRIHQRHCPVLKIGWRKTLYLKLLT